MLTAGTEGTLYEITSELFDEVVFVRQSDLDAFNSHREMEGEVDEIIGQMIEAAERAMRECALVHKDGFLNKLRIHSMHYYEFWFKGTDELIAEGWSVGEDGLLDQTFYCKTEEPLKDMADAMRHLLTEFAPSDEYNVNLCNCLRPDTVANLYWFNEIDAGEFCDGCGIPA